MTSVVHESEGKETITDITKYDYDTFGTMFLPTAVRKAQLDDGTPYPCDPETLQFTPLQRIVTYDTMGNPTELIDRHGIHTAFLWGYKGMYPIARAHGMTSASLDSLLDITDNSPLQSSLSSSQRAKLLNNPGVLVEIYEHEPLVGMTKHYDNKGHCTLYDYDIYGRLIGVTDDNGKLKQYEYTTGTEAVE